MSLSRTLKRQNPKRFKTWGECRVCGKVYSSNIHYAHLAEKHPRVFSGLLNSKLREEMS